MLLLASDSGAACVVEEFPFTIGRSSSAGMRLESSGVWDVHASVHIHDGRFYIQPEGAALLLVNDERSSGTHLRLGDQISLGGARLFVSLSPASQYKLSTPEFLNWTVVLVVALTQVLLLLSIR